jgi:glycosyltransferase involved in cell wall biosynthesis
MTVTVVIPCFNQAHFLPAAIRSVQRQDGARVELIVVDDGSTDDTSSVAAVLGVATVIRQRNRGLSAARNAGLRAARGEFILFLDADDELLPGAIETGLAALLAHPHADGVVRRCQLMDRDGRPLPTEHAVPGVTNLYREWLLRNFVWTPGAAIFRRDRIADVGGFPEEVGPAADYAVYLTLARAGRMIYDARDVVRYRQHEANMSRDPVRMLRATLTVLRRERPHVPAPLLGDFRRGKRAWRDFYGEQIVEDLRAAVRARPAGTRRVPRFALLPPAATLVWQCPRVFWRHASKKLLRMMRGLPPADLEPGRFAPVLRRPGDTGR